MILYTPEVLLNIINCKVDMVRIRLRIPGVAVGTRIEAGENALTATEVMPPWGDAAARFVEHRRVVRGCLIDAGNGHNHAEYSSRGHVQK